MKHHLIAQNIAKEFVTSDGVTRILESINVTFKQGTSYALMGTSGVGKSTFMHLLAGLESPSTGSIIFNDQDVAHFTESARTAYFQTGVGLVFQTPYLIRELTVKENVMLAGMVSGQNAEFCAERAQQLLKSVGLQEKTLSKPGTLSIGQQQRVALCRALFNKPAFLIADEPTGALDEKTGRAIIDLVLELRETLGMGIIVSTHDQYVAQAMDEMYEIDGGALTRKK